MAKEYKELRKAVIDNEMTMQDLADRIGISTSAMSNIMNGKRDFRLCEIKSIIEVLELDSSRIPQYFFN